MLVYMFIKPYVSAWGGDIRDSPGVRERRRSRRWGGTSNDKTVTVCFTARVYRTCNVFTLLTAFKVYREATTNHYRQRHGQR